MYNHNVIAPFGNMNTESAIKVARHFEATGSTTPATSSQIGVSGSFMSSLCQRGYVEYVGKKQGDYYPVGDGLYRRSECNLYTLRCSPAEFWAEYTKSVENCAMKDKYNAQAHIAQAQCLLNEAQRKLSQVKAIHI